MLILIKYLYFALWPFLKLASIAFNISMADLAIQFGTATLPDRQRQWIWAQCYHETVYKGIGFNSPICLAANNLCNMKPSTKRTKYYQGTYKAGDGQIYAKYDSWISSVIDLLDWYDNYGDAIKEGLKSGASYQNLVAELRSKDFFTATVIEYVTGMFNAQKKYKSQLTVIYLCVTVGILSGCVLFYVLFNYKRFFGGVKAKYKKYRAKSVAYYRRGVGYVKTSYNKAKAFPKRFGQVVG